MMESHQSKRILFLGEQDGDPEKDFKLAIQSCVANNEEIKAVYLLRVSLFETPGVTVALCIYPEVTARDSLLECISSSFRKIFMTGEQLDILFLAEHQKLEVDAVARPFFER